MISICNEKDILASMKYMVAEFSREDTNNDIVIGSVYMTKKFNNKMSKEKQKAVKQYLQHEAGKSFEVKNGSKIVLVFNNDKGKVEVTFDQKQ